MKFFYLWRHGGALKVYDFGAFGFWIFGSGVFNQLCTVGVDLVLKLPY